MRLRSLVVRGLTAVPLLLATGCAQGPGGPSALPAAPKPGVAESGDGTVRGAAAGDVKNGPLEILNVRVRPSSGPGFYAFAGGTYKVASGSKLELWVEWSSERPLSEPPRLVIDWDASAASDRDNTSCGSCLLTHAYDDGVHTVKVTLDDRVSGTTTRTFEIDARPIIESDPPSIKLSATFEQCNLSLTLCTASGPLSPTITARIVRPLVRVHVTVTAKDHLGNPLPFVLESADCNNCDRGSPMFSFPNFTFALGTPDTNWAVLGLTNPIVLPPRSPVDFFATYSTTDSLGKKSTATVSFTIVP